MNINILEEKIAFFENSDLYSIIELIINAVKDYPLYGLNDTDTYFQEVRRLLNVEQITLQNINDYIEHDLQENNDSIWIRSSLDSLLDSFDLMELYKISLDEVIGKIEELNYDTLKESE